MDGPHKQVHRRFAEKKRQEGGGGARGRLGSRRRSLRLHALQKITVHVDQPEAPLPQVRGRGLRAVFE